MIEYTITPLSYDPYSAFLKVVVNATDTTLSVSPQTFVVPLTVPTLEEILELSDVDAQKAIIRKEILKFNASIQEAWEAESAVRYMIIPTPLASLLGVPGTTPVTQTEIDAG